MPAIKEVRASSGKLNKMHAGIAKLVRCIFFAGKAEAFPSCGGIVHEAAEATVGRENTDQINLWLFKISPGVLLHFAVNLILLGSTVEQNVLIAAASGLFRPLARVWVVPSMVHLTFDDMTESVTDCGNLFRVFCADVLAIYKDDRSLLH